MAEKRIATCTYFGWLINKITPDQIDQINSAEIPDKHIDPDLFDVVTKKYDPWPMWRIQQQFTMHV